MRYFVIAAILWGWQASARGLAAGPPLREPVNSQMKTFAKDAARLHAAFFAQKHAGIELAIARMTSQIARTARSAKILNDADREHLMRMLDLVRTNLEHLRAQMRARWRAGTTADSGSGADDFDKNEIQTFKELAQMARIYDVSGPYRLFFCSSDRAFWLQSGLRPQDPLHPNRFPHCGTRVP